MSGNITDNPRDNTAGDSPQGGAAGESAAPPAQLNSLTGLRWIAACMVFFSHVAYVALPATETGQDIGTFVAMMGYVGVTTFFVLSGFVLTWSARAQDTRPKFWRRRFFKIYPNHFIGLLAGIAFMIWWGKDIGFPSFSDQLPALLPQVLLVHTWIPDLELAFSYNLVSWTLSVEAVFYLCFPFLLGAIRRIRPDRLWLWAGATVLVIFAVPQLARLLPAGEAGYEGLSNWQYWFIYVLPLSRMGEFVLGILLARIVREKRWIDVPLWGAWLVFAAGYVVVLNAPKEYAIVALGVLPVAVLIPAAAMADVRRRSSLLSGPVMVWLGNVSYAFYLLHFFAIQVVLHIIGTDFRPTGLSSVGFVLASLVAGVLAAWALYALVERPMMSRFATKRRPPEQPGTDRPAKAVRS
ncbi:acyltransferase family protein [Streptomyces rubiginosohelvolus]|uniref:acyltransferase family protein n=1 Tax=Streptomyces rubiginosohelvolus TaxID=67362 RepID=UPI0035D86EEB